MPTTAILFTLSTLAATPIARSMSSNAMARCPIHFISNFAALEHLEECAGELRCQTDRITLWPLLEEQSRAQVPQKYWRTTAFPWPPSTTTKALTARL